MSKLKHTHKLKRVRFKTGNAIFFCALPDCSYKIQPPFALGKRSICWRCGNEFIMDEYTLRLAKPHCTSCHKPKTQPEIPMSNEDIVHEEMQEAMLSPADKMRHIIEQAKLRKQEQA